MDYEIEKLGLPQLSTSSPTNDSIISNSTTYLLSSTASFLNQTTLLNQTTSVQQTTEVGWNITGFLNVTSTALTNATVEPTRPLSHTRYCKRDNIGCIPTNGVCKEFELGGNVAQKCECHCGFYGTRCDLLDVLKYFQVCQKWSYQKGSPSSGISPVEVIAGAAVSLLLLMLIFWFIYWRMCKYRYRIRQLERELSWYRGDDVTSIISRLPPGTYWHNAAFQPDEELEVCDTGNENIDIGLNINLHSHPAENIRTEPDIQNFYCHPADLDITRS